MSPDPRVLLRALRNCPNLETLQFYDYAIPYEWPVPGDVAVVHLPLLKELGIFDTSDTSPEKIYRASPTSYLVISFEAARSTELLCAYTTTARGN
ncbi:hypothetical protein DICSQDRAFT_173371 [Dichomitus squalens LYAD-421 SS1]|uniref:F-box domain-containing protein n=1 Tax=Dichomitus squalens (strain LYAD-421) TaxID=732165 RepID=R7SP78_DICSQ|nr:uncharacterized protein DICSQDRAFT_173371 [Dichomitus squalens LYAD-421 SS1]EJF58004.1 hypothetical protein DICSQDRAFT_173371 [Dichomitus squalens LYAD-421 SS1]